MIYEGHWSWIQERNIKFCDSLDYTLKFNFIVMKVPANHFTEFHLFFHQIYESQLNFSTQVIQQYKLIFCLILKNSQENHASNYHLDSIDFSGVR